MTGLYNAARNTKLIREHYQHSISYLSKSIGVNPSRISRLEKHQVSPHLRLIDEISEFYDVHPALLLIDVGESDVDKYLHVIQSKIHPYSDQLTINDFQRVSET